MQYTFCCWSYLTNIYLRKKVKNSISNKIPFCRLSVPPFLLDATILNMKPNETHCRIARTLYWNHVSLVVSGITQELFTLFWKPIENSIQYKCKSIQLNAVWCCTCQALYSWPTTLSTFSPLVGLLIRFSCGCHLQSMSKKRTCFP